MDDTSLLTPPSVPDTGVNLLLVDADAFQRHWLRVMLKRLGADKLREADTGREVLAALQDASRPVDLCMIDLHLPDMDVVTLLRRMGELDYCGGVVLCSALGDSLIESVAALATTLGVNLVGCLPKPVTQDRVLRLLHELHKSPRSMTLSNKRRVFSLDDIEAGIEAGQLTVFFQPKVEMSSAKVVGMESLLRWKHPEYGLLEPARFLPALEAASVMRRFTLTVIARAAAACAAWERAGLPLRVSVNLSVSTLTIPNLTSRIEAMVRRFGVKPASLSFDIHELASLGDASVCVENLARLRWRGFGLSVEDDGNAHSNVRQLQGLPFTDLKIGRMLVAGSGHDPDRHAALNSCLTLANTLRRQSVAIGVESREDWELLRRLGCTHAQGYYIAPPMEQKAVLAWVKRWEEGRGHIRLVEGVN